MAIRKRMGEIRAAIQGRRRGIGHSFFARSGIPTVNRFAAVLLLCVSPIACEKAPSDETPGDGAGSARPNIVFIVVEDLGPRIGAYGDPLAETPNIDQLAAEGITYTNVFTSAGVCAPSRAALMTGVHQQALGAQHMRTSSFGRERAGPLGTFGTDGFAYEAVPPPDVKAFPELLRANGYYTTNNSKTDYQFGQPFTIWDENGRDADWRHAPAGQPFFAMFSQNLTHESRLFIPAHATATDDAAGRAREHAERLALLGTRTDPAAVIVPDYLPDTPLVRQEIAQHYDNIRLMDDWVGEQISLLEEEGVLDETVVIFTTDHGDGFPRAKRFIYDSGLHVPFIVRYPDGKRAGAQDDRLVSFVDVAPYFLHMTGTPSRSFIQGRNVFDDDTPQRRYVFAARDRLDEHPDLSRAVRDERYKFIRNQMPERALFAPLYFRENLGSMQELRRLAASGDLPERLSHYFAVPRVPEELYDTETDPHELINLAADPEHRETLLRMRSALDDWLRRTGELGREGERAMVLAMWPDGEQPVTLAPLVTSSDENGGRSVNLSSPTTGASIAYRFSGEEGWRLYTGAVSIPAGTTLEAKAIRYGYAESVSISYP